ncbi:MAG: OmpA family protein, partial [Nitrospirae bacterium]|nr:OmpA family protein [Nitrospirota bacterium]
MIQFGGDIFRSIDNGLSWEKISPILYETDAKVSITDLKFDSTAKHRLMLSSKEGVFASTDNGITWVSLYDGLDINDRRNIVFDIGNDGRIQLAGRQSGKVYSLNRVVDKEFISGNIYFASGSSFVNDNLKGYLNNLSVYLKSHLKIKVKVEGHTDDIGDDDSNMKLSLSRANSVKNYLTDKGISEDRIITIGKGKSEPIVPNTSSQNRARNRRVELTLIGGL